MLDAIEDNPNIIKSRVVRDSLDDILQAWGRANSRGLHIRKMFRVTSPLRIITGSSPSVFDKPHTPVYDEIYLDWFDGLIMSLTDQERSVINFEVFRKRDRKRADKWAKRWNKSVATYYRRLKKIREYLVEQLILKATRGW